MKLNNYNRDLIILLSRIVPKYVELFQHYCKPHSRNAIFSSLHTV